MDYRQYYSELDRGQIRNLYLFFGPEAYIRKKAEEKLTERVLTAGMEMLNTTVLENPSVTDIIESCETLPLMSDRRLVIVRNCEMLGKAAEGSKKDSEDGEKKNDGDTERLSTYLSHVPDTCCLLFDGGESVDKRKKITKQLLGIPGMVEFSALNDKELYQWMRQEAKKAGKGMDADACEKLAFFSGQDLKMLYGEIGKLASYAGDRPAITAEDVAAVATRTAEARVFDMVDNIIAGKVEASFEQLKTLLQAGESRLGVLALITRQYRLMMYVKDMMKAGKRAQEMAGALAVAPFVVNKLTGLARQRTEKAIRDAYAACTEAEYAIKSGQMREDICLDRLILVLTMKPDSAKQS